MPATYPQRSEHQLWQIPTIGRHLLQRRLLSATDDLPRPTERVADAQVERLTSSPRSSRSAATAINNRGSDNEVATADPATVAAMPGIHRSVAA